MHLIFYRDLYHLFFMLVTGTAMTSESDGTRHGALLVTLSFASCKTTFSWITITGNVNMRLLARLCKKQWELGLIRKQLSGPEIQYTSNVTLPQQCDGENKAAGKYTVMPRCPFSILLASHNIPNWATPFNMLGRWTARSGCQQHLAPRSL